MITVKELKEKLKNAPDDMDVMLMQTDDEFAYNAVNTAEIRPVKFHADEEGERDEPAIIDCFVITDEY